MTQICLASLLEGTDGGETQAALFQTGAETRERGSIPSDSSCI
jgi:hypothetical protein